MVRAWHAALSADVQCRTDQSTSAALRCGRIPAIPGHAFQHPMHDAFAPLQVFLTTRFADRVVLTFREIEDLLGFTLPTVARIREDWWTTRENVRGPHRRAWMMADRTASPNLPAKTVLFERTVIHPFLPRI